MSETFLPQGHSYLWMPGMIWLQVIANAAIGLSYLVVSVVLVYLLYRIRNLPFQWIYIAFGIFVASCGFTHFMEIWTIWHPTYWLDVGVRFFTAAVAIGIASFLVALVPRIILFVNAAKLAYLRGARFETDYIHLGEVLEKSKELDELKTQFFANVSHELRTPLALILGPTERIKHAANLSRSQQDDLDLIERNTRILQKQVNDLLDIAKLEAGKMSPSYKAVDLVKLIQSVKSNYDGWVQERCISFKMDLPNALKVELDPEMFQRIFSNLLSNAFKFVAEGGEIEVSLKKIDKLITLSVADNGPGISPDLLEAVFERFRQLEGGSTRLHGGTGLGLSIVKEFVELHRGKVFAGRSSQGGALFTVEFPEKAPEGVVVQPQEEDSKESFRVVANTENCVEKKEYKVSLRPVKQTKGLVLVVEDNEEMNRFLSEILSADYHVETAFNGKMGLDKAIKLRPDLILSDIMMPVMSGNRMVEEIRRHRELDSTQIIILSAKADDELKNRLLREGAQDYVLKPFSYEEVLSRVRNLVTMKRVRDGLQLELDSQVHDLEELTQEVVLRRRELERTVESLQEAKEAEEQASKAKSVFLGIVSHELKTPMTSLRLQLQLLRRIDGKSLSLRQLDLINKLDQSSRRSIEMMDTLLEYTKLQSGKVELMPESMSLFQVVSEVIDFMRPLANEKGLGLRLKSELNSAVDDIDLVSDRLLVQTVIRNLITNAIKYTEVGFVEVRLSFEQGAHKICVQDTGPGIPKDQQEAVFQPFKQLCSLEKKTKSGFGLGLAIARDSVKALGGRIELISNGSAGATFMVKMPSLPQIYRASVLNGIAANRMDLRH